LGKKFAIILLKFLFCTSLYSQPSISLLEEYVFGNFRHATRIVIGMNNDIYVLDDEENKVYVYSDLNQPPISIGGYGWSFGSFDKPSGLVTDGVNVYVSDFGNHRIQRFDRKLNYISSFSTRDSSESTCRFGYPRDIALSESGDLFILDGENTRIVKFNPMYLFERAFGDIKSSGKAILRNPLRIIAKESKLFVMESKRVVVYDYFGNYIKSNEQEHLDSLKGIAVMEDGYILVKNNSLMFFSSSDILLWTINIKLIFASEPIQSIQDIAVYGDLLYILAPKRIHVFRIFK